MGKKKTIKIGTREKTKRKRSRRT